MIPKIIHYCWFGNKEIDPKYKGYIEEWRTKLIDFEFKFWNEQNIPTNVPYVDKAMKAKEYANVSNYIRLWAVYNYGGIYLDVDVKILKPIEVLLIDNCFFGKEISESSVYINNAIFGAIKNHWFIKKCLIEVSLNYQGIEQANVSSPLMTSKMMKKYGFKENNKNEYIKDIKLYNNKIFYPFSWQTPDSEKIAHENTILLHDFAKQWSTKKPCTNKSYLKRIFTKITPKSLVMVLNYGYKNYLIIEKMEVQNGPFVGLKFDKLEAHGSSILPKIIGSYEECLHEVIYEFSLNRYYNIYNFGCGEGYYVMGFSKLMNFTNKIIAFDLNFENIKLLRKNIEKNSVQKVEIRQEKIAKETINNNIISDERSLIFCDIEGDEEVVFNSENIKTLESCDLIIELHTFIQYDIKEKLSTLFKDSHEIQLLKEDNEKSIKNRFLSKSRIASKLISIVSENRPETMEWMVLRSKNQ